MTPAVRLGAYGVVLALALGGGAVVGDTVGPLDTSSGADHVSHDADSTATLPRPPGEPEEDLMPSGLTTSAVGYTFEAERTDLDANANDHRFRFRITGPEGEVVRDFEPRHERELHFIVVDRDLATFSHLHPTRADDGTWSVELGEMAAGVYRAYADFAPTGGPDLTLGVDLAVAGDFRPAPLPPVARTDTVDGYEVTLTGAPVAGSDSEVTLTVARDGRQVTDLDPYLGAFGHLVAIRAGDLAYLHVHPLEGADDGGPEVRFTVAVPTSGDYRLFFDFAHGGAVHTAAFTVDVPAGDNSGGTGPGHGDDDGGDDGGHGDAHGEN